jgi:hypothetical protein
VKVCCGRRASNLSLQYHILSIFYTHIYAKSGAVTYVSCDLPTPFRNKCVNVCMYIIILESNDPMDLSAPERRSGPPSPACLRRSEWNAKGAAGLSALACLYRPSVLKGITPRVTSEKAQHHLSTPLSRSPRCCSWPIRSQFQGPIY